MTFLLIVILLSLMFICGVSCSVLLSLNRVLENSFDILSFLSRYEKREIRLSRKKGKR